MHRVLSLAVRKYLNYAAFNTVGANLTVDYGVTTTAK